MKYKEIIKDQKDFNEITEIFEEAFPESEKMPVDILLLEAQNDNTEFLSIYDEDKLIGISYVRTRNDLCFVLYLAVNNKYRGNGYGSKILEFIQEKYNDKRIVLNIEELDNTKDNYEQRVKRKNFYIKNGFKDLEYKVDDGKTVYEVLSYNGFVSKEEYSEFLLEYKSSLKKHVEEYLSNK